MYWSRILVLHHKDTEIFFNFNFSEVIFFTLHVKIRINAPKMPQATLMATSRLIRSLSVLYRLQTNDNLNKIFYDLYFPFMASFCTFAA